MAVARVVIRLLVILRFLSYISCSERSIISWDTGKKFNHALVISNVLILARNVRFHRIRFPAAKDSKHGRTVIGLAESSSNPPYVIGVESRLLLCGDVHPLLGLCHSRVNSQDYASKERARSRERIVYSANQILALNGCASKATVINQRVACQLNSLGLYRYKFSDSRNFVSRMDIRNSIVISEEASKNANIPNWPGRYNGEIDLEPHVPEGVCRIPVRVTPRSSSLPPQVKVYALGRKNNVRANLTTIKRLPMPPKPCTAKPVTFTLLNTRSVRNESLIVKDFVVEHNIDILAMTETWLSADGSDELIIRDICPKGFDLLSVPRGSRGGGVALLYRKLLKFKRQSQIKTKFKSFEFTDLLMNHSSLSLRVAVIYRPPPSKSNNTSNDLFFEELIILQL